MLTFFAFLIWSASNNFGEITDFWYSLGRARVVPINLARRIATCS
jgi:hypothetical protein